MHSRSSNFYPDMAPHPTARDIIQDHRARVALEEDARAERRRRELYEQSSSSSPAATRIRAWEKVHGLRLPLNGMHAVLEVVASGTGLTLAEVRQEQRARLAARSRS